MTLLPSDIKWAHVEASSKCNAWCPACPRNNHGFGLRPGLIEQDIDSLRFEEIISGIPTLYGVQFCGNLGDPIAAANINELINISKKYVKKVQIHTNGSLRNTTWWRQLAMQLSDLEHDVWFGIDGLAGVHETYRQGTDFEKIINNAREFIDHGGHATWQFIPYKHNEHQVIDCLKLSQQMKFKKFQVAKLYRRQTLARHYKTGVEFDLLPSATLQKLTNINRSGVEVAVSDCMHLSMPSIYVSAAGYISRCCYLSMSEQFQSVDQLLDSVMTDLTDKKCIKSCG